VGARNLDRVRLAPLCEQPFALGLTNPELLWEVGLFRCRLPSGSGVFGWIS